MQINPWASEIHDRARNLSQLFRRHFDGKRTRFRLNICAVSHQRLNISAGRRRDFLPTNLKKGNNNTGARNDYQ